MIRLSQRQRLVFRGGLLFSILVCAGCDQQRVEVYQIPKQSVAMEDSAKLAPPPAAQPARWEKPADWQEQPLTEMRQASFKVAAPEGASADISVTSFPGEAGGIESNVNRWRGQLELPPLAGDELEKIIVRRDVDGVPAMLVDFQTAPATAKPSRILGAIFELPDRTWFVKMTGETALLEKQKTQFDQFVQSFRFSGQGAESLGASMGAKSTNDQ